MPAGVKFDVFTEDLARAKHNLDALQDQVMVFLSNTAPNASTHTVKTDIPEIATGFGYTGPIDIENFISRVGAVTTIGAVDKTVTANGGTIATFRYIIMFNNTHAAKPLIGYWDWGGPVSLLDTQSFIIDFINGSIQIG